MTNDHASLNFKSDASGDAIRACFEKYIPGASWRGGDSDALGKYFVGASDRGFRIKVWTDVRPIELSVTFLAVGDAVRVSECDREALVARILNVIVPELGFLTKFAWSS